MDKTAGKNAVSSSRLSNADLRAALTLLMPQLEHEYEKKELVQDQEQEVFTVSQARTNAVQRSEWRGRKG
ncbi:hypothetical protein MHYP_G00253510 [Metynnis hypsauchen]